MSSGGDRLWSTFWGTNVEWRGQALVEKWRQVPDGGGGEDLPIFLPTEVGSPSSRKTKTFELCQCLIKTQMKLDILLITK